MIVEKVLVFLLFVFYSVMGVGLFVSLDFLFFFVSMDSFLKFSIKSILNDLIKYLFCESWIFNKSNFNYILILG